MSINYKYWCCASYEHKFYDNVAELEQAVNDVVVYAKLPKNFTIPTPFGGYNPDWAIAFNQDSVHHVYFVAETKGSVHAIDLREREQQKIASAGAFFDKLGQSQRDDAADKQPMPITYAVVSNFEQLMQMVGKPSAKLPA